MNADQIAKLIDAIDAGDPESAHGQADDILLDAVPDEVRQAYMRLVKRCRWWAAS